MKVQELLFDYLYQTHQLRLPSIGLFQLDAAMITGTSPKEEPSPDHTIRFTQDSNATTDEGLLQYLVEHTGKMKPLAQSDLESFIISGMQLLNIGKPFHLKGIGTLHKSGTTILFSQGAPVAERRENAAQYTLKDRTQTKEEEGQLDFSSTEKKSSRKPVIVAGSILVIALLAWAGYLAFRKSGSSNTTITSTTSTNTPVELPETDTATVAPVDTATTIAATNTVSADTPVATDTSGFVLQIKSFRFQNSAIERLNELKARGHNVSLANKDSVFYLLLAVKRPLSDTSYVMDSLKRFYLWKTRLLKNGQL